uniref:ABC transporter domain-containing protein n=1 Tax=Bos indicus x Bos taurus TaxID=30522 RepID=A0A4W2DW59_BOBOX
MNLLTLNQFAVLLWKNFTLKVCKVLTALAFPMMLLLLRAVIHITVAGPYTFTSQPISTLPSFLQNDERWELIYVPSNIDVVKEITENVKRNLNISIKVQGFSSEIEFEKYIKYDYRAHKVLAAIVFDCDFKNRHDPLPLQVKYHLRFAAIQRTIIWPDETGWKTTLLFPNQPSVGPRNPGHQDGGGPGYIREGFLAIQHALDKAIILYHESSARQLFDDISILVQRFPYPAYPDDGLLLLTGSFLPLMFILMFSPTVLSIIRSIVWEKEKRLKFSPSSLVFIWYYLLHILHDVIIVLFDYSFIFVFLMCYAIASIFFGFMVSTFFNKARLAASAGSFIYFVSFFPFNSIAQYYGRINLTMKVAACLSPNIALALGIKLLVKFETKQTGVNWNKIWTPATLEDNLTFGHMMGMLVIDAFLYGLVTWYIEAVFPGQYGMPQPWYFFLMHSYWFSKPRIKIKKEEMNDSVITQNKYFEAEPTGLVAGIKIKHLYKVLFQNVGNKDQWYLELGDKVVINNMSLNLYKGQITILLGQNGAGKTTALSILTGHYPPTRGEVFIDGYDITKNITEIRENLGFCPQGDLLFNDLTLSEHLFFYSMVKNIHQKMSSNEINHILSTFDLLEKRDTFSKSLSGGTKRKLSIIIALLGGSKVVILDEPSSGMDPFSRRATWDILQQFKHDRTILLTTHYMDEADILGDRIAIMVKGTLQCCGSSIFLKKTYGAGYHIVMEREPHCDLGKICAIIESHIPDAILESYLGAELSFILPKEHAHRFEALFNDLEMKKGELGVANFGASITTMEEVFLKPTNGSQVVLCLAFGLAVVIGSFCLQTVTERATNAKHIQFVSGVYLLTYWLSALLWDLIYFSIACCFLLVSGVFIYCGLDAFVADFHFLDTMMIFMLYGWSVVPLMYLGSLLFSSSTTAYIKLTLFNYFSTVFIFKVRLSLLSPLVKKNNVYSFGEHGIANFLISSAALGLIFLLLLFCLESTFWNLKNFVFHKIVFNVYKIFMNGKKTYYKCPVVKAVRNISLLVPKYECFGLLGLNGAGKTTTFKMLTGEEITTSGVVLIDGINITENIRKIRSRIGYCPQSDPMLGHMTGREVLIMYARLRGVPEPDIGMYVETFLYSMHMETHADKLVCTYSGGNKGKLNTAIALMGKSSVVFLDEPSTGMDPVARRHMWDTVTGICNSGKAIVISSHSMEECEALCTRLAIMVKGKFKCLGSPRHLKNKFGNIYTLTAKINIGDNEDKLEQFKEFIETNFPGNIDRDHHGIIGYYIPSKGICWGKVFHIMEEAKTLFNLVDYFISQITLEQIFLTFANIDKAKK